MFTVEGGIEGLVREIRRENGFPESPFRIDGGVRYDEGGDKLFIIAHDRTDKSVIIGNSFVIGKLRERLGVRQVTVYSNLDLEMKGGRKLEEAERLVEGTELEFLLPVIEAEKRFPPRRWPDVTGEVKTLVFMSFNARALLGFAERLKLPHEAVGIRYAFPRLRYEPVEGQPGELFFPDEGKLVRMADERGGGGARPCRLPLRLEVRGENRAPQPPLPPAPHRILRAEVPLRLRGADRLR